MVLKQIRKKQVTMGGGSYSHSDFTARAATLREAGYTSSFTHTADIQQGRIVAQLHPQMNPSGVIRESRDSAEHPTSNAIAIIFDVTGSMRSVPQVFQQKLSTVMEFLVNGGFIPHPQVLVGAIDDVFDGSVAPLQVGQFESNINIDVDLGRIYLEGGGGGTDEESYDLALEFLLSGTSIDCYEKRHQKGHAFIIGDERSHAISTSAHSRVLGRDPSYTSLQDLVNAVKQKYHVSFIIPQGTANYNKSSISNFWDELIGANNVYKLDNPAAIAEAIAYGVGFNSGVNPQVLTENLRRLGAPTSIANSVEAMFLGHTQPEVAPAVTGAPGPITPAAPDADRIIS